MRVLERNASRAGLVKHAEDWRWGSLWRRVQRAREPLLTDWPLAVPRHWVKHVNEPQTELELAALRRCVQRNSPYGGAAWTERTARELGLTSTLRPRGRPKLEPDKEDA